MSLQNAQAEMVEALLANGMASEIFTPASHISIYRNNMVSNLLNALKDTYPLVFALLGEPFFLMAAKEYLRQYPSRSGDLNEYGEYFSDFLAGYQPIHDLIYLAEVAEFEWICHSLYTAVNHPPFATHALNAYSEDQYAKLHFTLNPASNLHRFHYPIMQIVDLCKTNPNQTINLHSGGVNLLILRRHLDLALIPLNTADFLFLEALQQNHSLSEALEIVEHLEPNYPLAEKLPWFFENLILVDCYVLPE